MSREVQNTSTRADGAPEGAEPQSGPRRRRLRIPFAWQVVIGLLLGIGLGLVAQRMNQDLAASAPAGGEPPTSWLDTGLETVGGIFVTLLRTLVPPLIFLAVVTSIAELRRVANAARLAWRTLLWFAVTALIAVTIGILIGVLTNPGVGAGVTAADAKAPSTTGSWLDFLGGLVPGNFLGLTASMKDGEVRLGFDALQILVISIAVGVAAVAVGRPAEPFLRGAASLLEIAQKLLWWVIRLAPIGTAGLIGHAVAAYGWQAIAGLGVFVADVTLGILVVFLLVYPLLLKLNGLGVRDFYRGVWPATMFGFVSRSSLGTMPVTREATIENLGVPRAYASFAVPLGATTKMDGCAAIYPALAAIFVANFYGVPLEWTHYLLIVLVAVLGSAATAGVTGATVMLTLTLSTLGLPLEGVGLLLAVDPIIDMARTALNVTGQALVPTIVAKREGILDGERYRGPNATQFA